MTMKRTALLLATVAAFAALSPTGHASTSRRDVVLTMYSTDVDYRGLFVMSNDGTGRRRILRSKAFDPQWSPDRRKIAFVRERCREGDCDAFIYLIRPDGSGLRRFAGGADSIGRFDWSPDGRSIVYEAFQQDSGFADLYIATVGEKRVRHLTETDDRLEVNPDWSPDGARIVYSVWTEGPPEGPRTRIYSNSAAGDDEQLLTEEGQFNAQPRWSPDGTKIAFITTRDDTTEGEDAPYTNQLYVMDADGSDPVRISTDENTVKFFPNWSADSTHIAWSEDCNFDYCDTDADVWVAEADGESAVNVTDDERWDDTGGQWAPTGNRLLFHRSSQESSRADLYRVRPDGSDLSRITRTDGLESEVDWQTW